MLVLCIAAWLHIYLCRKADYHIYMCIIITPCPGSTMVAVSRQLEKLSPRSTIILPGWPYSSLTEMASLPWTLPPCASIQARLSQG